jgi:hypothetical protein
MIGHVPGLRSTVEEDQGDALFWPTYRKGIEHTRDTSYTLPWQPSKRKERSMLNVGEVFPALTLPRVDGGDFAVESLHGKRALLFWWGSW